MNSLPGAGTTATAFAKLRTGMRRQGLIEGEVANKVHYVCNSRDERQELDAAVAAEAHIADLIGLESDGCLCVPLFDDQCPGEWCAQVVDLMDGAAASTTHVYKPYRDQAELLKVLKEKYPRVPPPPSAWVEVGADWLKIEAVRGECYKRVLE